LRGWFDDAHSCRTAEIAVVLIAAETAARTTRRLRARTRSKDTLLATGLTVTAILFLEVFEKRIVRQFVFIQEHGAHLRRQHRQNDVFSNTIALQLDQMFRIQLELARPVVNDCDDGLFLETCFDEFHYACVGQWTVRLLSIRQRKQRKTQASCDNDSFHEL